MVLTSNEGVGRRGDHRRVVGFRNAADPDAAAAYRTAGWWGDDALVDDVRRHVVRQPDRAAYISELGALSWSEVDQASSRLGRIICAMGHQPGDRIAVVLPDSATVHVALLALEKAGITTVGIGARAGVREIAHLVSTTGARTLIMADAHRGETPSQLRAGIAALGANPGHIVEVPFFERELWAPVLVDGTPHHDGPEVDFEAQRIRPDDLFLINSTSGTTGLPKCVLHTQNRWRYFHQLAEVNGELSERDVIYSAVPAPFGFGLWTSHFTPIQLGATAVVHSRFRAPDALRAMEDHGVTVFCCVSTQFLMLLNEPSLDDHDLSSLRVMFTGGEAVPATRAQDFEQRTGCRVLQFYGSNETGVLSGTRTTDPTWVRFETAGQIVPEMQVRLYDRSGRQVVSGEGRPACRGPATCLGYLDIEANEQLFTPDGWMLMGDLCTIDDDGYLRVTGRTSDIIIRGGKNISAGQVEDEVGSHPSVALAAAVPMPDPVFGERVCVFVELREDAPPLDLEQLRNHLIERGTSVELIPEVLVAMPELPRSSGAKIAKGVLAAAARKQADQRPVTPQL